MAKIIRHHNIDKVILDKFDEEEIADIFTDLLYYWGTDTGDLLVDDFWTDQYIGWNYFCNVLDEDEFEYYTEEVE